jgi:hypothetical protein
MDSFYIYIIVLVIICVILFINQWCYDEYMYCYSTFRCCRKNTVYELEEILEALPKTYSPD